jgi:zinc transporter ZupT
VIANATLVKAFVGLAPVSMLFVGALILFCRRRSVSGFLQLFGAGCLIVVVLSHVAEALELIPWMHWGHEHSAGHYLDLWSAIFGVTCFPVGYLVSARASHRRESLQT